MEVVQEYDRYIRSEGALFRQSVVLLEGLEGCSVNRMVVPKEWIWPAEQTGAEKEPMEGENTDEMG